MAKSYEDLLQVQIARLRNTAIVIFIIGAVIFYGFISHGHKGCALVEAIITLQASIGSFIMMKDVKRDLREVKDAQKDA